MRKSDSKGQSGSKFLSPLEEEEVPITIVGCILGCQTPNPAGDPVVKNRGASWIFDNIFEGENTCLFF